MKRVYETITALKSAGKKSLAVLVDPDKMAQVAVLLDFAKKNPPDFFLVGGSLLSNGKISECIQTIRSSCEIPVVLFPGSVMQVDSSADALLLLSVISGRNPELLIGKHVAAAPLLKNSNLEIIPTGYMLIESGAPTTVSYISNTQPVPREKNEIAFCTALAGEQLGLKLIYLEGGSGAKLPVPVEMIKTVRAAINIPLITGGGLTTKEEITARCRAGADVIVVGNILETVPSLLPEFSDAVHSS